MIVPNDALLPLSIDQHLLDAVVKLTCQRDQETLAQSLVDTISHLTNASIVSVYSLGGELGHLSAKILASSDPYDVVGSHITPLDSRPELCDCIENKRSISIELNNGHRTVYPILEQGSVSGLLLCENMQADIVQREELIHALVAIYSNHQSLLNHQQRDGLTGLYNRVALQNWLN